VRQHVMYKEGKIK